MQIRRCETCAKLGKSGKCMVLTVPIGIDQDCWAWTDDPKWLKKVNRCVALYIDGWRGEDLIGRAASARD